MYQYLSKKRNRSLTEAFSQQIFKADQLGSSQILPLEEKRENINSTMSSMMYKCLSKKMNFSKKLNNLKMRQFNKSNIYYDGMANSKHKNRKAKDKQNIFFGQTEPTNLNIKILKLQKKYLEQDDEDEINMFPKDDQFLMKHTYRIQDKVSYQPQIPQLKNINLNSYTISNMASTSKYNLNFKNIKRHLSLLTKEKSTNIQNITAKKYFSKGKIKPDLHENNAISKNKTKIEVVMPFRKYFKANRKKCNNSCSLKLSEENDKTLSKLLSIQQN